MSVLIAILIGLASGVIAALCGVGGGALLVPAFVFILGLGHKHAVATSLAVIIPTALIATLKYHQSGFVNWRIFFATAVGAIVAAYFATDLMKTLSNHTLTRIFAVFLILVGLKMLFTKT